MNIIIPMAGRGSRLRPHTLTIPKPLIPVAGKPIVQRLVEDIVDVCDEKVEKIGFVIGDFGKEVEENLKEIAADLGAEGYVFQQESPEGTAHAIDCARDLLDGPVIVGFADTLFRADFKLDHSKDGIIWVNHVDDPRAFGVVKLNDEGVITDFVEKPETPVSNLAIIGIYFFKEGSDLRREIQYLLDNDIREKGEYQLTNALENLKKNGARFGAGEVKEWLDCGNKNATVHSNQRVLEFKKGEDLVHPSAEISNSVVIPPCFIGEGVKLEASIIGPHVSIGKGTEIANCRIINTIVQENTRIFNKIIENSMVGNHVKVTGIPDNLSIGDYTELES
jgi:glucose-1-phosphate thymidylyltransferase